MISLVTIYCLQKSLEVRMTSAGYGRLISIVEKEQVQRTSECNRLSGAV